MADATTTTTGKTVGATTRGAQSGALMWGSIASVTTGVIVLLIVLLADLPNEVKIALLASWLGMPIATATSGLGARQGGKNTPTDQGDALYAQEAVDQVDQIVSRLAAAQAAGPAQYAPTAGEQPVTEPTTDDPVELEQPVGDEPAGDPVERLARQVSA